MELDTIVCGDCLDILLTIPSESVDAVITDPPYPCIKRDYGYWTEAEWWSLIAEGVVPEVRRILKPTGSAVFILQPNSRKVGSMRGWLWEFMAWVCREWNMVQDVWWWNTTALPLGGSNRLGLMRSSIKACVWCGSDNCYTDQTQILWEASQEHVKRTYYEDRSRLRYCGLTIDSDRIRNAYLRRGGVTPFNVIPCGNANDGRGGGSGHPASTPLPLCDWWTRYIVPPGGLVVDPFIGSGTMALAAIQNRCHFFGCDTVQEYVDIANERIAKTRAEMAQMEMAL